MKARIDHVVAIAEQQTELETDPLDTVVRTVKVVNNALSSDALLIRIFTLQRQIVGRRVLEYAGEAARRIDELNQQALKRAVAAGRLTFSDIPALVAVMRHAMQGWLLSASMGGTRVSQERMTDVLLSMIKANARSINSA